MGKAFGLGLAGILGLALLFGIVYVSYSNKEVRLRNAATAQETANQAIFDNVWKTIAQTANVKDDYKEEFRKSWADILAANNSGSRMGSIQVFVNRVNPKFDGGALSKRLMVVIESQRKEFLNNQKKLVSIKQEHDNIRTTFPGSVVCGGRPELKITIVTSGRTQDTFDSGREDDISLRPGTQTPPADAKK